ILTVILQTVEIRLQREELEHTRDELHKNAEAQERIVALNTLSTLAQYYMSQSGQDGAELKSRYAETLKTDPDRVVETIPFKIATCTRLLEELYLKVAGAPLHAPDVVRRERRRLWISELQSIVRHYAQRIHEIEGSAALECQCQELEALDKAT